MTELKPLTGHTVSSRRVHNGQRISLRVDEYALGDRSAVAKEIVEHPGSVVILPFIDDARLVLVRQWRQAAERVLLEAPSGTREPGEDPHTTAMRELREETGFEAGSLVDIGSSWVAPGYSTEFTHAFLARNLTPSPLPQDQGEDIHTVEVAVADIPGLIRSGEFQDQMTIAIFYTAMHVFHGETVKAPLG